MLIIFSSIMSSTSIKKNSRKSRLKGSPFWMPSIYPSIKFTRPAWPTPFSLKTTTIATSSIRSISSKFGPSSSTFIHPIACSSKDSAASLAIDRALEIVAPGAQVNFTNVPVSSSRICCSRSLHTSKQSLVTKSRKNP